MLADPAFCPPPPFYQGLLKDMAQQGVQPNLLTFNAVLKALGQCGSLGRSLALQTLSEMKALRIGKNLFPSQNYPFVLPNHSSE